MNRPSRSAGFTLLETLIGLALFGLIMLAITNLFRGTLDTASAGNAENELLSDMQLTQQVIAGRATDAVYVYPTGSTLVLSGTATAPTTRNTLGGANTNTQNWTVGTDPIVAMILPPLVAAGPCNTTVFTGCYRLFAYYPILRSYLLSNVTGDVPNADARNPNQWVMMEYRKNLVNAGVPWTGISNSTGQVTSVPNSGYVQGASGKFLTDYFQPGSVSFTVTPPATGAVGRVAIQFTGQRFRSGSASAALVSSQSVTVYPRNWK
ncbi:hypothetical protein DKM44_06290 [Deinococcus irradiatisoli]|uniref:Prepilin-type cleavage/methylation domain-containing protein n=1 Tax=Deinococcus irradiatisoli TaxID=2202254 RepID=A0A2Z3JFY4_9DEIO|nr:type II secretion system protein [Deinococcus irradiatisoli]AWN22886.1 hypothetical protein DKM44_06290 [Deinococcus irradiatisoli]